MAGRSPFERRGMLKLGPVLKVGRTPVTSVSAVPLGFRSALKTGWPVLFKAASERICLKSKSEKLEPVAMSTFGYGPDPATSYHRRNVSRMPPGGSVAPASTANSWCESVICLQRREMKIGFQSRLCAEHLSRGRSRRPRLILGPSLREMQRRQNR